MNLIEATNYYLDEAEEPNGIMDIVTKILKMFKIDTSIFTDPTKAKEFLDNNQESFAKANALYDKVAGVSESYMSEGVLDIFKGLNTKTLIMFIFIAISGILGEAHATINDLYNNMQAVASKVKIIDVDFNDPRPGYQTIETGHADVKKILQGLNREDLIRIKRMASNEGLRDWSKVKNALETAIINSFILDKGDVLERLNGLNAQELKTLIRRAMSKVE